MSVGVRDHGLHHVESARATRAKRTQRASQERMQRSRVSYRGVAGFYVWRSCLGLYIAMNKDLKSCGCWQRQNLLFPRVHIYFCVLAVVTAFVTGDRWRARSYRLQQ